MCYGSARGRPPDLDIAAHSVNKRYTQDHDVMSKNPVSSANARAPCLHALANEVLRHDGEQKVNNVDGSLGRKNTHT